MSNSHARRWAPPAIWGIALMSFGQLIFIGGQRGLLSQEIAGGGGQPVVAVGMGMALVLGGVAALVVAVRRLARQLDSIGSRGAA